MNRFHYNIVGNNKRNEKRLFISGTSALVHGNMVESSPNIAFGGDRDVGRFRSNKVLLSPLIKPNSSPKVKSVMKIRANKELTKKVSIGGNTIKLFKRRLGSISNRNSSQSIVTMPPLQTDSIYKAIELKPSYTPNFAESYHYKSKLLSSKYFSM